VVEKRAIRGKGDWTPVNNVPVKDTHFKVANLIEGSDVEFRVAAVNDAGLGKPSKSTGSHRVRDPICKCSVIGSTSSSDTLVLCGRFL